MKSHFRALTAAALALFSLPVLAQQFTYTDEPDGTRNRWLGKLLVSAQKPDGTLLEFGYDQYQQRSQTRRTRPGKPPEVISYPPQPLDPGQVTYDECHGAPR